MKKKQSVEGTHRFHVMNRSNPCVKTYPSIANEEEREQIFIHSKDPSSLVLNAYTHTYIFPVRESERGEQEKKTHTRTSEKITPLMNDENISKNLSSVRFISMIRKERMS